jgi:RNA polymerase sigma-70 factor (ECF subfamily)
MEAASQPGDLVLALPAPTIIDELWNTAEAVSISLTKEELAEALTRIGEKYNYNQPPDTRPNEAHCAAFYRGLQLKDFALAQACALGHELAWSRFLQLYRTPLTHAAIAIARDATLGHELADNLYAELYGLRSGHSPLASYSGRGSFLGWLRTTLAQRHIDHHRRTHRESPLDELDTPAPAPAETPAHLAPLATAVTRTLEALPAEDRYLLASYFLDRQTLLQIGRLLRVHEATISRRIKRLTADLRHQLLHHLQSGGLSHRAAEEALGTDPRDLEINLRSLLQAAQTQPFPDQTTT